MTKVVHLDPMKFQNKVLVTHTDLDGVGCAFLFLRCYPTSYVYFADYNNVDEILTGLISQDTERDILITDISPSPEVAEALNQRGKVALLDHHDTAKWLAEKYEWAHVDTTKCGTGLVYDLLVSRFNIEDLEDFVDTVEDWDLWGAATGNDGPDAESIKLNLLLDFYGRDSFLHRLLNWEKFDPEISEIMYNKMMHYCDRSLGKVELYKSVRRYPGTKFGIVVGEQHKSLVGHHILKCMPDLEFVLILDPRNQQVSLRGRGNVHLGELAKETGYGGGHPKAAGMKMDGITALLDILS